MKLAVEIGTLGKSPTLRLINHAGCISEVDNTFV